jgi:outer membrane receptor for ferrienterochelin and colicin
MSSRAAGRRPQNAAGRFDEMTGWHPLRTAIGADDERRAINVSVQMIRNIGCLCALLLVTLLMIAPAAEAQQPLPEVSLEDLMRMDAGRVFGASERTQPVTEAPSSVSFITADEIARYNYRSLADILRGVRGLYVTTDRNFSYVGVRGFSKPGDYNSRILLLINGHRVNDNVFGQAEIGPEFGVDPAMF